MKEIKIGIILNYTYIFCNFAIGLIFTPILIAFLGKNDYGIYSLALALASYLSLLDLGVGNSIVRYIAKNKVEADKDLESKLIGFFFKFFFLISVITLIVGIYLGINVENIVSNKFSDQEIVTLKYMIFILTLNFAIGFIFNTFSAVLQAYEFFIFLKSMTLLRIIMTPILTYIILLFKVDLILMTLIILIVNTAILLASYIYYKKKLNIRMSFKAFELSLKKEIIFFALIIFVVVIADKLYWQTGQIILGIFKGPEEIAIYALGIQFINIFLSLSGAMNGIFLPKITVMITKNKPENMIGNLYMKISKYQLIIISLFLGGFIIYGEYFIALWVGEEFIPVYILVIILMSTFFFDLIQNLGNTILQAKGKYYFRAIILIICSTLNLITILLTIEKYGMYAIVISTAIFIFIGNVLVMNIYYHKSLNIDMIKYWKIMSKYLVYIVSFNVIGYLVFSKLAKYINFFSWMSLLLGILIYSCIYSILVFKIILDKSEKNIIKSKIKGI